MTERPQPASADLSLKDTMRRLRIEEAERTGVIVALRDAEFARLAILHDRLKPVLAQVPDTVDLFDTGLTPGETPRLWIDMIAFVEMGRDKRTYRFLQDTRNGRRVMVESDDAGIVADRATAYIARRLIERERLLALPPVDAEARPAALPRADMPAMLVPSGVSAHPHARAGISTDSAASAPPDNPASAPSDPAYPHGRAAPVGDAASPAETPSAPAEGGQPATTYPRFGGAPPPDDPPERGVRFSGLGGLVLFLLGAAAGIAGLLGFAQLAARL